VTVVGYTIYINRVIIHGVQRISPNWRQFMNMWRWWLVFSMKFMLPMDSILLISQTKVF